MGLGRYLPGSTKRLALVSPEEFKEGELVGRTSSCAIHTNKQAEWRKTRIIFPAIITKASQKFYMNSSRILFNQKAAPQ